MEENLINSKLEFDCKIELFYMVIAHNNLCNLKNYDRITDISESINKLSNYK